jgi:hypothetical protein
MKTENETVKQILNNLKVLKDDCENFREWNTLDKENWRAMIDLIEATEKQIKKLK